MTNKKLTLLLGLFGILFLISLGIFLYLWFKDSPEKLVWLKDPKIAYSSAEEKGIPILLAFVDGECDSKNHPDPSRKSNAKIDPNYCPDPEGLEELRGIVLLSITKGSPDFQEYSYDDRFVNELDHLPKFFLLNSTGELRDIQSYFPEGQLLERWKNIK